jgi:hypothetical protein
MQLPDSGRVVLSICSTAVGCSGSKAFAPHWIPDSAFRPYRTSGDALGVCDSEKMLRGVSIGVAVHLWMTAGPDSETYLSHASRAFA